MDSTIIREEVQKCYPCLVNTQNMEVAQSFAEQVHPKMPRTDISFDIVTGLPVTAEKKRCIYACVCNFSNYFLAASGKSRKARDITDFF